MLLSRDVCLRATDIEVHLLLSAGRSRLRSETVRFRVAFEVCGVWHVAVFQLIFLPCLLRNGGNDAHSENVRSVQASLISQLRDLLRLLHYICIWTHRPVADMSWLSWVLHLLP